MPKRSPLGIDEQQVAEELFVEVHTVPKPWGEGLNAFLAGMQHKLRYSVESRSWPIKKEALKRAYPGLHRKAEQGEWIVRAGRGWRSTPAGLAYVQGHLLAPGEWKTQDLHDIALCKLLRSVLRNLGSASVGTGALDPTGIRVSWAGGSVPSIFGDLRYHFRVMGIPGEENPATCLTELDGLRRSYNSARKRLLAKARALLRKARADWDGKSPLSLGPLGALVTFLDEYSRNPTQAEERFASPTFANDEIRVGGSFIVFAGPRASEALPDITRAWTQARASAIRTLSDPFCELAESESKVWLSLSNSRAALRKALAYPHYPGLCQFRRRAQARRSR